MKLGGGLIAPKDREMGKADMKVITRLSRELKAGLGDRRLIVVSGSGNFGHKAVKEYGIDTPLGVAKVQKVAREIGKIVADCLLELKIPASLISPHDIWPGGKFEMAKGIVPVLYGDVVWEGEKAVIYSGEKCIAGIVPDLRGVEKIFQVGSADGVWDENKNIIPTINWENWQSVRKSVGGAAGTDYTGGMMHKVEISLEIAKKFGIKTIILNGRIPGRLNEAIEGGAIVGTTVI